MRQGGRWLAQEAEDDIIALELKAVYLSWQSLVKESNSHIQIFTDNTTTMPDMYKMVGTRSPACIIMTRKKSWGGEKSIITGSQQHTSQGHLTC